MYKLEDILRERLKERELLQGEVGNIKEIKKTKHTFDRESLYENIQSNNNLWDIPNNENITSHRKSLGRAIVFCKKVVRKLLKWYVTNPLNNQKLFNGSVTRSLNEVYKYIEFEEKYTSNLCDALEKERKKVDEFKNILDELVEKNESLQIQIDNLNNNMETSLNQKIKILIEKSQTLEKQIVSISEKLNEDFDVDYLEFENKFRGSELEVRDRQLKVYSKYIRHFKSGKILDVGCGRGELVQGLGEEGFQISGIDLNKDMVEYCNNKGLDVIYSDVFDYLSSLEDGSLCTIFALHVLEHFSSNQILNFIKLAHQKLAKGGLLIIETPNAECLYPLAYGFSIDLTHKKILHPYTLEFIVSEQGFKEIELKHLSPVDEATRLENLVENVQNKVMNENINKLNNLLYSYQDFAIIARK